jgi:hypothetical protein
LIFGALQVTKVLSTEEVKRAIEGPGKDFGKSKVDRVSADITNDNANEAEVLQCEQQLDLNVDVKGPAISVKIGGLVN